MGEFGSMFGARRRKGKKAISIGGLGYNVSFYFLMIVSVVLVFFSNLGYVPVKRVEHFFSDLFLPVLELSTIVRGDFSNVLASISDISRVYEENQYLREENKNLLKWRAQVFFYIKENEELRRFTNFQSNIAVKKRQMVVRLVRDRVTEFGQSFLLFVGRDNGISLDDVVLSQAGLVGRIVHVSAKISRVLLLSDIRSHVPVYVGKNYARAILSGDGKGHIVLSQVKGGGTASLKKGDYVMTSGESGIFFPGTPIGSVESTEEGQIFVKPFTKFEDVVSVSVVSYNFSDMKNTL